MINNGSESTSTVQTVSAVDICGRSAGCDLVHIDVLARTGGDRCRARARTGNAQYQAVPMFADLEPPFEL
jgi:hypothetical protein